MRLNNTREEWGERRVKVRRHVRNYSSGERSIEQFSAECPLSKSRRRLKHLRGDVYVMECDDGHNHLIDIISGNEIRNSVWEVATGSYNQPPPNFELVTEEDYAHAFGAICGVEHRQFIFNAAAPFMLEWTMFYSDPEMSEGVAIAHRPTSYSQDGQRIPSKMLFGHFTECVHEWRPLTSAEKHDLPLQNGQVANAVCSICGKVEIVESND